MAGLVGHNVCFPFWGNPFHAEYKAGMTFHGETGIARWKRTASSADTILVSADLPELNTPFTRSLHVAGQIAYFEESGENLSRRGLPCGMDRTRHLGSAFPEKSITATEPALTPRSREWRHVGPRIRRAGSLRREQPIDLRTVRNIARSGFGNNFLVDPRREYGFFAVHRPGLKLLFGHIFPGKNFP